MQQEISTKDQLMKTGSLFLLIASIVLIIVFITQIKMWRTDKFESYNSISVLGKGEVVAIPDIAKIDFAYEHTDKDVSAAQATVSRKISDTLAALGNAGIAAEDMKTNSYTISQQYDYRSGGRPVLTGYTLRQGVTLTVRDLSNLNEIVRILGEEQVTSLQGPNLDVDAKDELIAQARSQAIKQAEAKAKQIAKDLGVRIVRVISYYDESDMMYPPMPMYEGGGDMKMMSASVAPSLPLGENTITSRVNVTYKIK